MQRRVSSILSTQSDDHALNDQAERRGQSTDDRDKLKSDALRMPVEQKQSSNRHYNPTYTRRCDESILLPPMMPIRIELT